MNPIWDPNFEKILMKEIEKNPSLLQKFLQNTTKQGPLQNTNILHYLGPEELNSLKDSLISSMEKAKEMEKMIKEVPPFYNQPKSIPQSIKEFSRARDYNNTINNPKEGVPFKQTFMTTNLHSSKVADLSKLKPIFIREMMVNKIHLGSYLICRVISSPFKNIGSFLLIEDEIGDVEDLSIYNYPSDEDSELLFPEGTVFFIKEPFLKITLSGKGTSCIRVDSPSDILVDDYVYSGKFRNELNQLKGETSIEALKQKGNYYYNAKKFDLALRCYKIAIDMTPEKNFLLHLNCSAALLEMEKYFQAYKAGEKAIELMPADVDKAHKEKAYFRMGKAAYKMREWRSAFENISLCLKQNAQNNEALMFIEKIKQRMNEETKGIYNFSELSKQLRMITDNGLDSEIDIADYFNHELLMIDESKNKGKHIIARQDIPKKTLLIVSRAFSYGKFEASSFKIPVHCLNLIKNTVDSNSQYENLKCLYKKVQGNPFLSKEIYSLYSGTEFDRNEVILDEIVDIARLDCISSYNSFDGGDLLYNFSQYPTQKPNHEGSTPDNFAADSDTGIWIKASLINHSCVANTSRFISNTVMIVFSTRNISKGEEITNLYQDPMTPYDERQKKFEKYGFECCCSYCESEKKNPNKEKIEKITKNLNLKEFKGNIEKIQEIISSIEALYSKEEKYQIELYEPLNLLAETYFKLYEFDKAAKTLERVYEIVKEFYYITLPTIEKIIDTYFFAGNKENVEKWKKILEDEDFFSGKFKCLKII